uniref:Protein tramtrack, alpha isoform n=1 Tax=Culex pipiens TaxID=7175 RepID=A0A8D8A789_CULPI
MNRTAAGAAANVSSVRWVDFTEHMSSTFQEVYANSLYTDVTLVLSDGSCLQASRMVLAMASEFFEDIFSSASSSMVALLGGGLQEIRVVIPDVRYAVMKQVLNFVYTGQVHMNGREMADFIEACQLFQLKGLSYKNGDINGIKISGSNIITPEQYEYEELQDAFAEEVPDDGVVESEVGLGETVVPEVENVAEKTAVVGDGLNQYYEVQVMDMEELETSTSGQDIKPAMASFTVLEQSEDLANQTHESDSSMNESGEGSAKKRLKNCEYGDRLEEAINSIVQGGVSFRTASIQYGIPKTVLWRKAVKVPNYKAERLELPSPRKEAIEALKSGEKLLNISKRFDIPLSTLHRDKLKLFSEGALPENVPLKQRDKTSRDRILEAAQQCIDGVLSQSEACKLYQLPKTTIWRKIKALRAAERIKTEGGASMEVEAHVEGGSSTTRRDGTVELLVETLDQDEAAGKVEHLEEQEYVVLV